MPAYRKKGSGHNSRERWCQNVAKPQQRHVDAAAPPHEQTITPAIEDYVKTIALAQQEHRKVTTNAVSEHLGVSAASVTKIFQRMQQLGLIVYVPYYGATLTEMGQQLAHAILRRNQLVCQFLTTVLGFAPEDVRADVDVLEHVISDALEQRIADYLRQHTPLSKCEE